MLISDYSFPFEKGKPSIFVIGGSPFQALCAIEAIKDLEIEEYKFVVCLRNSKRNDQTITLLNKYNIRFEIVEQNDVLSLKGRLSILKPLYNKYKRIFVGDFRGLQLQYCALRYASNNSIMISLDDGSCNVSLLRGAYKLVVKNYQKINYWYFSSVASLRSIKKDKYLYTIFSDISNHYILCCPNRMQHLQLSHKHGKEADGIFFIGTNTSKFAEVLTIKIERLYQLMDDIFSKLRHKHENKRIVYIPHGSDDDINVKLLCQKYRFLYERPDTLVELYMLNQENSPEFIYGFTSTALFTINRMFPQTKVINLLFIGDYPNLKRRVAVSEYYIQHGIERKEIEL